MSLSLETYLTETAGADPLRQAAATTILNLGEAAVEIARLIAHGGAGAELGKSLGEANLGGDIQKALDVVADRAVVGAMHRSPVAFYGSEEQDAPITISEGGSVAVACDPLDGSSNIETNVSIGTIFSILPVGSEHRAEPRSAFLQPGSRQIAAGFFIYGPQLLLIASFGGETRAFIHVPGSAGFTSVGETLAIPATTKEFSINAANRRHWAEGLRRYIADCEAGEAGNRGKNYSMRYVGSMVADAYRILLRGGVFLYPGDARKGYEKGRLRLVYEANPVALCIEGAGGAASDGLSRTLDIVPGDLHARTPLVFGSTEEVEEVRRRLAEQG
ncbi:class 1 fructose-bisphosphatase [Consotaella salsifontis]|uniref:Fructose-1,6-bisphosphatase class 1 n=1 Tax=Consotaella salsifontis TaxID=1365950 RepID=A0A1T4PX10_9HYPH|nr:class 1 fructose-bisphosphatase [Consotaella salsifontis]SJZ96015.1 D-fructose 1,6-bisphosphatase [Consotaella salsifontis]